MPSPWRNEKLPDAEEIIQNFIRNTCKEVTTWEMRLRCEDNIEIDIEDNLCENVHCI
jgi:hypothetical protein